MHPRPAEWPKALPSSASEYIQRVGRAIRFMGHAGLPKEERKVQIRLLRHATLSSHHPDTLTLTLSLSLSLSLSLTLTLSLSLLPTTLSAWPPSPMPPPTPPTPYAGVVNLQTAAGYGSPS